MAEPVCPPGYDCTFTPQKVPFDGPWWEGTGGLWVALVVGCALLFLIGVMSYHWHQYREAKLRSLENERSYAHNLAIEEQRTMQLDAAKGDPEMLRLVRSR